MLPDDGLGAELLRVTAEASMLRDRVADLQREIQERMVECDAKHSRFKLPEEVISTFVRLPPKTLRYVLAEMDSVERARPSGGGTVAIEIRRSDEGDWRWATVEARLPKAHVVRGPGNRSLTRPKGGA